MNRMVIFLFLLAVVSCRASPGKKQNQSFKNTFAAKSGDFLHSIECVCMFSMGRMLICMQNQTTILTNEDTSLKPKALKYKINNQPENVHNLLLQKSNCMLELVVCGKD